MHSTDEIRVRANFKDIRSLVVEENLILYAHYSPENKQIKLSTSTTEPKVISVINTFFMRF